MAIDKELKKAIADRLEGWEIVEFLQLPADYILEYIEDEVLENLDEIKELAGLQDLDDNDD